MAPQQRIDHLRAELAALEKQIAESPKVKHLFGDWQPAEGQQYFVPSAWHINSASKDKNVGYPGDHRAISRHLAFKTEQEAQALADAFFVMVALRHQPGAGEKGKDRLGCIYGLDHRGRFEYTSLIAANDFICPPSPTRQHCESAVNAVGRERVERAIRVWAMLPVEG